MVTYISVSDYIATCKTNQDRITALDAVIDQLMIASLKAAESGHMDEYWFDDGHVKIRSKYRSPQDVLNTIAACERMKQIYQNRKDGRMTQLIDKGSFDGGFGL